jgi:hypothetical protein
LLLRKQRLQLSKLRTWCAQSGGQHKYAKVLGSISCTIVFLILLYMALRICWPTAFRLLTCGRRWPHRARDQVRYRPGRLQSWSWCPANLCECQISRLVHSFYETRSADLRKLAYRLEVIGHVAVVL